MLTHSIFLVSPLGVSDLTAIIDIPASSILTLTISLGPTLTKQPWGKEGQVAKQGLYFPARKGKDVLFTVSPF